MAVELYMLVLNEVELCVVRDALAAGVAATVTEEKVLDEVFDKVMELLEPWEAN